MTKEQEAKARSRPVYGQEFRKGKGMRSRHSDLVDKRFAAEFLGVTTRTIDIWIQKRRIEVIQLSERTQRFRLAHLEELLKRKTIKAGGISV